MQNGFFFQAKFEKSSREFNLEKLIAVANLCHLGP